MEVSIGLDSKERRRGRKKRAIEIIVVVEVECLPDRKVK